jgi:polyisoprenyl-teichoic acid--peptidoglycan teichoic acid transferase
VIKKQNLMGALAFLLFIPVILTACAPGELTTAETAQGSTQLASSSPEQATQTSIPTATITPTPWATLIVTPAHTAIPDAVSAIPMTDVKAIYLILGSDRRDNVIEFKTDAIMLAFLLTDGSVSLVSIPRNTMVYIPGHEVFYINWAWYYATISHQDPFEVMADTIQYNFGVRPQGYAMIGFGNFKKLIDDLGGIDVQVAEDFHHGPIDEINLVGYTVRAGLVHMDGDMALWYARSRLTLLDDVNRGRRQQEVVKALYTRAVENLKLSDLAVYWNSLHGLVETELSLLDIEQGFMAVKKPPVVENFTLRNAVTEWYEPGTDIYFLIPDQEKVREVLLDATTINK